MDPAQLMYERKTDTSNGGRKKLLLFLRGGVGTEKVSASLSWYISETFGVLGDLLGVGSEKKGGGEFKNKYKYIYRTIISSFTSIHEILLYIEIISFYWSNTHNQ